MFWLITLCVLLLFSCCVACPPNCSCKWKGGKQTVECINRSMTSIPDGMESGTQVLDFSGNNLKSLLREKFRKLNLVNLQKIYLSRCRISHIDENAFRGLTNLVELDLSNNDLQHVPTETFSDFSSLMKLSLNGNNIQEIKVSAFYQLPFLTNLELNRCKIEKIEENAFSGLSSLEWLKLDNNRLTTIPGATTLPNSLSGITLENNAWVCDCQIIGLYDWLNNTKTPQVIDPVCSEPPRLKNAELKNLKRNDLACLPDIEPTVVELTILEGQNISLRCEVTAMPQAKVSWMFQGNILQNDSVLEPGFHLYYYIEEGTYDKQSELFIFNTNAGDNGTFICMAENSAGRALSNFTVKIVLKEERLVTPQAVTIEHFVVVIVSIVSICVLLTVTIIIFCIVKCLKQRRSRMKSKGTYNKEIIINNHADSGLTQKTSLIIKESVTPITKSNSEMISLKKMNGTAVADQRLPAELTIYTSETPVIVSNNPMVSYSSMLVSSNSEYHQILKQNPDLINDAKDASSNDMLKNQSLTIENGFDLKNVINRANLTSNFTIYESRQNPPNYMQQQQHQQQQFQFLGTLNPTLQLYLPSDNHLMPDKYVNPEEYSWNMGLPKLLTPPANPTKPPLPQMPSAYYRTLPHKRHSAANPVARYSREAEFLSRFLTTNTYEQYTPTDVRHNLEGYPTQTPQTSAFPEVPAPTPFADPTLPINQPLLKPALGPVSLNIPSKVENETNPLNLRAPLPTPLTLSATTSFSSDSQSNTPAQSMKPAPSVSLVTPQTSSMSSVLAPSILENTSSSQEKLYETTHEVTDV